MGGDSFCDWCMPKWVQSDKDFTSWLFLDPAHFIDLIGILRDRRKCRRLTGGNHASGVVANPAYR
jgi:hypothetical protein